MPSSATYKRMGQSVCTHRATEEVTMSNKEWEAYKEASRESTYAGLRELKQQAEQRLKRNNGEVLVRDVLRDKKRDR